MDRKDENANSTTENTLNDKTNKSTETDESKNTELNNNNDNNNLKELKEENENKTEKKLIEDEKNNHNDDKINEHEKQEQEKKNENKEEIKEDKKDEQNNEKDLKQEQELQIPNEEHEEKEIQKGFIENLEEDNSRQMEDEEHKNDEKHEESEKNKEQNEDEKHNEEEENIEAEHKQEKDNEENNEDKEENNNKEKEDNKSDEDNTEAENKDEENKEKENKEEEKEQELKEEQLETPHERSSFSLEGAKEPLSIYTRRVMDVSKIDKYLNERSSRGQVGGRNLGNTCFMNSSIACLSNCTELTYYFLKGDYLKDINEDNNLGMRGELAKEWGNLMKQYWVEHTGVGDPSDFKYTIGRKAERFRGYGQQDSNEFMSVFLDYLNEDLNKTTKKEYVELKEKGDNETDEECARRFWDINLRRNDSIITDLFCGQFKSTITCPECGWINITFDPFDTINLPLLTQVKKSYGYGNSENIEEFKFFYIPKEVLRHPYCLIIKNIENSEELEKVIERIKKEKEFIYHDKINNLFLVDMLRKEKYGYAEKTQIVRQFVYDEEYLFSYDHDEKTEEIKLQVYFYKNNTEKENKSEYPRMVFCKKDDTLDDIRKKIYFYLRKYILSPFLKEGEEKDEITLEIEKYMEDKKNELPYEKLYEIVENEYNKVFKKYDSEGKENENNEEEEKEKNDENKSEDEEKKENEEDENKANEDKENEDSKNIEKDEEKKENEEKKEENKEGEEEKENKEEEEKENKEINNNENEIKEGKPNEDEEKTNNKETSPNNLEIKKDGEINESEKKEDKSSLEDDKLKEFIKQFKSDIPFEIYIRKERDDNFYYGKIPFLDSKHFSTYSKKLKKFLEIEDFSSPLSSIQTDISDYEIIVQFNPDSKYINKETFDLDFFIPISLEYKIPQKEEKKEEEKKETEEEEVDDGKMTLAKCLKKFCKEEQLTEGDEWYCSKCKKHVLAKKKMDLYYLPKILIICFKRFIKDSYRWEKNEDEVEFPINNLDMKDFVIGPDKEHSKYDLFAVSQHYGSTGFGHYTAVCKNDGKWFSYNDSSCSETNESEAQSSAAYVLFYRRQTD